jgi:acetyltransferase-like isoleucine patch superfamily enzyme
MSVGLAPWVHPTALVEDGVKLGEGTKVWDNVHLRKGATIGRHCIIGEKTYVAYDVVIGHFVKINAQVYICAAVTVEDFCMISAHTVFTNDRFPRAGNRELTGLETSDPTGETEATRVRRGTTIGANATIGPGVTLGEFSMIGMGSVVTRAVQPYALVLGNPARQVGWVCRCGHPIARFGDEGAGAGNASNGEHLACKVCGKSYAHEGAALTLRSA